MLHYVPLFFDKHKFKSVKKAFVIQVYLQNNVLAALNLVFHYENHNWIRKCMNAINIDTNQLIGIDIVHYLLYKQFIINVSVDCSCAQLRNSMGGYVIWQPIHEVDFSREGWFRRYGYQKRSSHHCTYGKSVNQLEIEF